MPNITRGSDAMARLEQYRDDLDKLYVHENHTLKELIEMLPKEPFNVVVTKSQLERTLKKLGISKNLTTSDWKLVARVIAKRKEQGKHSVVFVHGSRLSNKKLGRELSRNIETTLERSQRLALEGSHPSGSFPPSVEIKSPSPVSVVVAKHFHTSVALSSSFVWELEILMDGIPWNVFQAFAETEIQKGQERSRSLEPWMDCFHADPFISDSIFFDIPWHLNINLQSFLGGMQLLNDSVRANALLDHLEALIPWNSEDKKSISIRAAFGNTGAHHQMEFFKLAIFLVSNGLSNPEVDSLVMEFLHYHSNRRALEALHQLQFATVRAFVEKLTVKAVWSGDLKLASFLLDLGAPIHQVVLSDIYPVDEEMAFLLIQKKVKCPNESALAGAFSRRHFRLAKFLLDSGVDVLRATRRYYMPSPLYLALKGGHSQLFEELLRLGIDPNSSYYYHCRPLFLAVKGAEIGIATTLIRAGAKIHVDETVSCRGIIKSAIETRSLSLVKLVVETLLQEYPNAKCRCKHKSIDLEDYHAPLALTVKLGLLEFTQYLVQATGHSCGSYEEALIFAVNLNKLEFVTYLLSLGADPNKEVPFQDSPTGFIGSCTALSWAIFRNIMQLVDLFLENGAAQDPESSGKAMTALQVAAWSGNLKLVQCLLDLGADVNAESTAHLYGSSDMLGTALVAAARHEDVKIVEVLLKAGANPGSGLLRTLLSEGDYETAIWMLGCSKWCEYNSFARVDECVKLSQQNGATEKDAFRLHRALDRADEMTVRTLVGEGARCRRLLVEAVRYWGLGTLQFLIDHGINEEFSQALTEAARASKLEALELLLGHHKRLGGSPSLLRNALMAAVKEMSIRTVRLLLDNGADIYGRDAAVLASVIPTHKDAYRMIQIMTPVGTTHLKVYFTLDRMSPGARFTPLQMALWELTERRGPQPEAKALTETRKLVWHFLQTGADINAPAFQPPDDKMDPIKSLERRTGKTALQVAVEQELYDFIDTLLSAGADVNAPPAIFRGATALQFAAYAGNFKIVRQLLEAGANVNALPARICGLTALEGAALNGRIDMVRFLLNAGADIQGSTNVQYRRAVGFAWNYKHRALAEELQRYKAEKFGHCESLEDILGADDVCRWNNEEYWLAYWRFETKRDSESDWESLDD